MSKYSIIDSTASGFIQIYFRNFNNFGNVYKSNSQNLRLFSIAVIVIFISCGLENKKSNSWQSATLDSLTLCMNTGFLTCCKPLCQNIEINLQAQFEATALLSTNAGIMLSRDYMLGDSVLLNFSYDAIPIYDEFRMMFYVNGYESNMETGDTIIEIDNTKLMKFFGTSHNKAVLNYVRFDGHGYLSLNLIDNRVLSMRNKVENINNIYNSIKTLAVPLPASTVRGNVAAMTNIDKCDCGDKRNCKLIYLDEHELEKESFVLVEQSQYSSCIEIALLANCIAKEYLNNKEISSMSFLETSTPGTIFKRLATFDIYRCNALNEHDFDTLCNYANCTWIDQNLSAKFLDPVNCEEWKKYVKKK